MNKISTSITVADLCNEMTDGQITVNRNYQRSNKVWPVAAKSYLVETVLLGYPIPKMVFHQKTDVVTRATVREIVDGQQRSTALLEFFNNELRLSNNLDDAEDVAGKTYDQLDEDQKRAFLEYGLEIDLFVSASPEEVRTTFRRINSYTVPLNYEEQRHASRQGPFKWFIHRLAADYGSALIELGVFRERQIVRMADAKLLTELSHALLNGITTTSRTALDKIYQQYDVEFPPEEELDRLLRKGLNELLTLEELRETALMKPLVVYSLLLALIDRGEPQPALAVSLPGESYPNFGQARGPEALSLLSEALENLDHGEPFGAFVDASRTRTNVASQRVERFRWLRVAI